MRKLLAIALLILPLSYTGWGQIGNVTGNASNQNTRDQGVRTVDRMFIPFFPDTTQANAIISQLPAGTRKTFALARQGNQPYWYYPDKWTPFGSVVSGMAVADGNNYVTSITFNNGVITIQRDGLGPVMSNSLDARYSLSSHTHPISSIVALYDSLEANRFYGYLPNESEPPTPSNGVRIYAQDGALKCKGSSGTVTVIALP